MAIVEPRHARGGTLVLGGGFAGSYVARLLGKRGATIVSLENFMLYTPMLPEAASGDAVIAVGGSWGTLTEIAFAKRLGRPVVILEPGLEVDGVDRAATPEEAVDFVLARVEHPS